MGQPGWSIAYVYDQLGNRLRKTEGIDTVTEYDYDVAQHGNRLLGYTVYAWPNPLWRVTFPEYNGAGNPTRMLTERIMPVQGLPRFERTTFYYDTAQRLWMTLKETWDVDGEGHAVHCDRRPFREFRYEGGGRGRYLTQTRDASPGWDFLEPLGDALWTDYDGDEPYLDYLVSVSTGQPVNQRRYLPGLGHVDDATGASVYAHGDQIGTLRRLTDGVTGATVLRRGYTAFGEPALSEGAATTRYGYAGAWGYETGLDDGGEPDLPPLPFLHVGERWYDPATGRFLQRDPIGIRGGWNSFAYANNNPNTRVDPSGLTIIVFHWRGQGLDPGHTAAYSTETGAYLSRVPNMTQRHPFPWRGCIVGYPGRTYQDDLDRYGNPDNHYFYERLDEQKFRDSACARDDGDWSTFEKNCISAVTGALHDAGAPAFSGPPVPPMARRYFETTSD